MDKFKVWLKKRHGIPRNSIKIALPKVKQQTNYSCGAAALMAICRYFDTGPEDEASFMKLLSTNSHSGTSPENIIKTAKSLKLNVKYKLGMTINELINYLNRNIPVICSVQAWGNPNDYDKTKNGHYVVAIGYDKDKIYFEDPSMAGINRGFLTKDEFGDRWHDRDCGNKDCYHLGIAIWRRTKNPHKKLTKAKKIQ